MKAVNYNEEKEESRIKKEALKKREKNLQSVSYFSSHFIFSENMS